MIVPTLLIGFLFHRTITEPMRELIERTNLIGKGDRDALGPLKRHGTSEFARLSQSFLDMARRLDTRSNFISTFATHVSHELKSPLTSIQGAAELLRDDVDCPDMDDDDRRKFLDNIIADADRLAKISGPPARFRPRGKSGRGRRHQTVRPDRRLRSAFASLDIRASGDLDMPMRISRKKMPPSSFPISPTTRVRHGSSTLELTAARQQDLLRSHGPRQWRRRLAQQPGADLRQLLHHAARQRRHRHGTRHRARHARRPWRHHPPHRFRKRHRVRADDPGGRGSGRR